MRNMLTYVLKKQQEKEKKDEYKEKEDQKEELH